MLSLIQLNRNILNITNGLIKPATTVSVRHKRAKKRLYWPTDWLPFTWEFPERPVGYFNTGDSEEKLETYLGENVYKKGYEFLNDRKDVPESVKLLFKLSNSNRKEITAFVDELRTHKVRRNEVDTSSHEFKIARYTSLIRQLQEHLKNESPNDVMSKMICNKCKLKRHRRLNELYRMDRTRYNLVIEKLNIKHETTQPGVPQNPLLSRKGVLRSMTAEYCENVRKTKLEAYHEELKKQQPSFEKEKAETSKWIEEMKAKYEISEDDLDTEYRGRLLFNDPPKPRKKAV